MTDFEKIHSFESLYNAYRKARHFNSHARVGRDSGIPADTDSNKISTHTPV